MTVAELIAELAKHPLDATVAVSTDGERWRVAHELEDIGEFDGKTLLQLWPGA